MYFFIMLSSLSLLWHFIFPLVPLRVPHGLTRVRDEVQRPLVGVARGQSPLCLGKFGISELNLLGAYFLLI